MKQKMLAIFGQNWDYFMLDFFWVPFMNELSGHEIQIQMTY